MWKIESAIPTPPSKVAVLSGFKIRDITCAPFDARAPNATLLLFVAPLIVLTSIPPAAVNAPPTVAPTPRMSFDPSKVKFASSVRELPVPTKTTLFSDKSSTLTVLLKVVIPVTSMSVKVFGAFAIAVSIVAVVVASSEAMF